MARIVIIGAGSGFGSRLSIDILSRDRLSGSTIGLCDIHPGRLEKVTDYVQRAVTGHSLPARIESSTDHNDLLPGADVVITSVSVGGHAYAGEPFMSEMLIPREYGVDQTVGDTVGPGGIFRFLRTAPVQLGFCKDMEKHCPDALLLNYTNPMCMLTWLHSVGSSIRNVGLCHSVQHTTRQLAERIGVPYEDVSYLVAGINHMAWIMSFRRNGEDLYPQLRALLDDPKKVSEDTVRYEVMRQFGYFVTESTRHCSEYLPYFRRDEELATQYELPWERQIPAEPRAQRAWMKETGGEGDAAAEVPELKRSHEYASAIIEAQLGGETILFNGNVMNHGLISNLSPECCVEVPCYVDREGVHPCKIGAIPPQCAALNQTNIAVQELAVKAVLERDREAAFHATALDPLTASVLPLPKIREMFDRMWEAEGELLAYFDE